MRLEIAQRLLKETTRPIISIGLECGFGDISYFGRAFHSAFGQSPREFRREQLLQSTRQDDLAAKAAAGN
jgi:AraC family carnitine catabolism transcriptional activator